MSIKIKTGVVKRLHKEYLYYQKEEQAQRKRIEKLKESNADEHDIKKQYEVLEETLKMLPDCKKRILAARNELEELIGKIEGDSEEATVAREIIVAASEVLDV